MKHHSQIRGVQREAVQQFFGASERHQDIDESQGIQSEGNPQPNNRHVEKRGGTNPPSGLIISALDSLSAAFKTIPADGGANRFGVTLGFLGGFFQMFSLEPSRTELFLANSVNWKQRGALFYVVECALRKLPHLQQLFPMGEVTVSLAMANDAVSKVLGDSGKLG